jgi:adenylate cyclase class IV
MSKNNEKESKILEVDFKKISEEIISIWWVLDFYKQKFTAVWVENELWYKYRIRKEWENVVTEHKEILSSINWVKDANETPMRVYDFEEARDFAKIIWFSEISYSVKERTQYLLDLTWEWKWEVKIVLDDYSDLDGLQIPILLEIEAVSREVIVEVAKLLWYNESDLKDWWARSLVEYYSKKI